jgi:hypothetical protein
MASIAASSLTLALSLFICLGSAWIYSVPSARHHLDRVSFRLLLWTMAIEIMYSGVYIYLYSDVSLCSCQGGRTGSSWARCGSLSLTAIASA